MNWAKLLKEAGRYLVKNWKYVIPVISSGVQIIRGLFKRKKKEENEKYLHELNTPHV